MYKVKTEALEDLGRSMARIKEMRFIPVLLFEIILEHVCTIKTKNNNNPDIEKFLNECFLSSMDLKIWRDWQNKVCYYKKREEIYLKNYYDLYTLNDLFRNILLLNWRVF